MYSGHKATLSVLSCCMAWWERLARLLLNGLHFSDNLLMVVPMVSVLERFYWRLKCRGTIGAPHACSNTQGQIVWGHQFLPDNYSLAQKCTLYSKSAKVKLSHVLHWSWTDDVPSHRIRVVTIELAEVTRPLLVTCSLVPPSSFYAQTMMQLYLSCTHLLARLPDSPLRPGETRKEESLVWICM